MIKLKRSIVIIVAMFIGFSFGMYLAAVADVAQDMTLGQAIVIVKGDMQ